MARSLRRRSQIPVERTVYFYCALSLVLGLIFLETSGHLGLPGKARPHGTPTGRLLGYREPWLKTLNCTFWSASPFPSCVLSDLTDRSCHDRRIEPCTHLLKSLRIGQAFAADLDVVDAARRDTFGGMSRDYPLIVGILPYGIRRDSKDS